MRKVRIKRLPNRITDTQFGQKPLEVHDTLRPVDRESANLEAEKNEYVVTDMEGDGIPENYRVGGSRHSEGGTPLNLPEDSFIFSDTRDLLIKDKDILNEFAMPVSKKGKSKSYTPAQIAKKYNLNDYKEILRDPMSDKLQIDTAEKMITNHTLKLGKLALVQESMKGFPQGIPAISMPYLQSAGIDPEQIVPQEKQNDGQEIERQMEEAKKGGSMSQIRKRPGMSNAGKYTGVKDFAGPNGTYPINTIERGRSALRLAHNSSCPECIKRKVYAKYPSLKQAQLGGPFNIPGMNTTGDEWMGQGHHFSRPTTPVQDSFVPYQGPVDSQGNSRELLSQDSIDIFQNNRPVTNAYQTPEYDTMWELPELGMMEKFNDWKDNAANRRQERRNNRQRRNYAPPSFRAAYGGNMTMARRFPGLNIAEQGGQMGYPGEEHSQMIEQETQLTEKQQEEMLLNEIYMKSQQDPDFIQKLPPHLLDNLLGDNQSSNSEMYQNVNNFEDPRSSFDAGRSIKMPYTDNPFVDAQEQEQMQQAKFGGLHKAQRGWFNRKDPWARQNKVYNIEKRLSRQNERRRVRDYAKQFDKDYDKSKSDYELFHLNKFKKKGLEEIIGPDVQLDESMLNQILSMDPKKAARMAKFPELNKFNKLSGDQISEIQNAFGKYIENVGPYSTEKYFENMNSGESIDPLMHNPEVLEMTEDLDRYKYQPDGRFAEDISNSAKARYLRDNPEGNWNNLDQTVIDNLIKQEQGIRLPNSSDFRKPDNLTKRQMKKWLKEGDNLDNFEGITDRNYDRNAYNEYQNDVVVGPNDQWLGDEGVLDFKDWKALNDENYQSYDFVDDIGFESDTRRKFYPNQFINDKLDQFRTNRDDRRSRNNMIKDQMRSQWYQGKDALEGTTERYGGPTYQSGGSISRDTKVYNTKEEAIKAYQDANGTGTFVWKDGNKMRRITSASNENSTYENATADVTALEKLKHARDTQNWTNETGVPISDEDLMIAAKHIGFVNTELDNAFSDPTFVSEFRDRFDDSISNMDPADVPSSYYDMTNQELLDLMKRHQRQNISVVFRKDMDQSVSGKAWTDKYFGSGDKLDTDPAAYAEVLKGFDTGTDDYIPLMGKNSANTGSEQFVVQEMYNILQETDSEGNYISQISPNFQTYTKGTRDDHLQGRSRDGQDTSQGRSKSDNIIGNTTIGHIFGAKEELYDDEEVVFEEEEEEIEPGEYNLDEGMADADWWAQDVINAGAAFAQPINKYMPHYQPVDPVLPSPVFYDPSRALAAGFEAANIASDTTALYGPQGLGSRLSNIQGQNMLNAANTLGDYEGKNITIANTFENAAAGALNQFALADQAGRKRFYDENTIANQQYDNAKNQKRENMRAQLVSGVTNRAQAQALNELYPNYQVDPRSGGFVNWDGTTRELGLRDYGNTSGGYQSDLDQMKATGNYSTEEIKAILDNRYNNRGRSRGNINDSYLNDYFRLRGRG